MNDFSKLTNAINSIIRISDMVRTADVSAADIRQLGRINQEICNNLEWLSNYVNGTHPEIVNEVVDAPPEDWYEHAVPISKPDWTQYANPDTGYEVIDLFNYPGFSVDDHGNVYHGTDICLPVFVNGEIRVMLGSNPDTDMRRVSVLMTQAFKIAGGDHNNTWVAVTKNRNCRDLRRNNIIWVPEEVTKCSLNDKITEDISRRIVEFDGNINQILNCYIDSTPKIDQYDITKIMKKTKGRIISDSIFTVDKSGTILPTPEIIEDMSDASDGFDVFSFLLNSNDIEKSIDLIKEKITQGRKLSFFEREIVVLSSVNSFDGTTDAGKDMVDKIKNDFCGYTMSQGYINRILNRPNPIISKIVFGGVIK